MSVQLSSDVQALDCYCINYVLVASCNSIGVVSFGRSGSFPDVREHTKGPSARSSQASRVTRHDQQASTGRPAA